MHSQVWLPYVLIGFPNLLYVLIVSQVGPFSSSACFSPWLLRLNAGFLRSRSAQVPYNGLGCAIEVLQGAVYIVTIPIDRAGPDMNIQAFLDDDIATTKFDGGPYANGYAIANQTIIVDPGLVVGIMSTTAAAFVLLQPLYSLKRFKNYEDNTNRSFLKVVGAMTDAFEQRATTDGYTHLAGLEAVMKWDA